MATKVGRGKMQLAAFDSATQKTLYRREKSRKTLLRKPSYRPFCLKFRCYSNGGRSGKMQLAAFDDPFPKNSYKRKNLAKIFYASRVIAHFVSNFVAMATGVGREKSN